MIYNKEINFLEKLIIKLYEPYLIKHCAMSSTRVENYTRIYQKKVELLIDNIITKHFTGELPKFIDQKTFENSLRKDLKELIEKSDKTMNIMSIVQAYSTHFINVIKSTTFDYDVSDVVLNIPPYEGPTCKVWRVTSRKTKYPDYIKEEEIQTLFTNEDWEQAKHGDIVVNLTDAGYRCNGVYMIIEKDGQKFVNNLGTEVDGYGHVDGDVFSVGPDYPIGYWGEADISPAYWHSYYCIEPVSMDILKKIVVSNIKFGTSDGMNYILFDWGKIVYTCSHDEFCEEIKYCEHKGCKAMYFDYIDEGVLKWK